MSKRGNVGGMSVPATAAYFRVLRETAGKSRAKLAAELGVSEMSIWRIEEEGQEPKAELLTGLVRALKARWEDVEYLLSKKTFGEAEGTRLAQEWLAANAAYGSLDEQEQRRIQAIRAIDALLHDPAKLDRLIGYADRLIEE